MGNIEGVDNPNIFTEKEIKRLYKHFNKLDKDKSGQLEPEEFFDVPEIAQNPLVKRVISIFDKNKDGKISFVEFINGLAALSTGADEKEKLKFAFKVYDMDEDGYISNGDLFKVLKIMVGNNLTDRQLQQLVDRTIIEADTNKDGLIDFEEFEKIVNNLEIGKKFTISYDQFNYYYNFYNFIQNDLPSKNYKIVSIYKFYVSFCVIICKYY